jgi:ribonuclease HIII
VQDSKALSASEIQKLAKEIQQLLPDSQYTVLSLQPAEYNETYESFVAEGFSLNQMLGSLHAKVFEKLYAQNADLKGVIIDQFGKPQDVTRYVTPTLTKQVKFVFETKAEKYTAVAAASILARAAFVNQMNALNEAWKVKFPLGATHVLDAGRAFVRANGKNNLTEVAKVHFKTTQTVLQ